MRDAKVVVGEPNDGDGGPRRLPGEGKQVVYGDLPYYTDLANLERVKKEIISESQRDKALARIQPTTDLEVAAADAHLIVEAIPEKAEIKYDLFRRLDEVASVEAILASNTSSISITAIAAQTGRPDRVIGMHFMNPVPVMALVEVIRGLATSDETTE